MNYLETDISPLSKKQLGRLLNAGPVRIKLGSGLKVHLSSEQLKKLKKAGLKGSAITVQLDPFAISKNQYLKSGVKALKGMGTGRELGSYIVTEGLEPLITASAERGVRALAGSGTGQQLGKYIVTEGLEPLITASAERGVRALAGSGRKRGRPKKIHGGKIGQELGKYIVTEGLEPLITASAERGVRALEGSGRKRGRPKGGKIGQELGKYIVTEGLEPLITASAERGVRALEGSGRKRGRPRKIHGGLMSGSFNMPTDAQRKILLEQRAEEFRQEQAKEERMRVKDRRQEVREKKAGPFGFLVGDGLSQFKGRGSYMMGSTSSPKEQDAERAAYIKSHGGKMSKKQLTNLILNKNKVIAGLEKDIFGGKVSFQQGLKNFRDTTKAVGQVFLPLNRGATGAMKRQIFQAAADKASNEINPEGYNPQQPTGGEKRRYNRSTRGTTRMPPPPPMMPMMPMDMPMDMPIEMMPMPKLKYSPKIPVAYAVEEDEDELPMPPTFSPYSATYAIPKGKLYASGAKRKNKVKRVMSQKQKDALAKGRHALRIKLNDMGAGARRGSALKPAGY